MRSKSVYFSEDIRPAFRKGVEKLAKAVKVTLGPSGKNVVISRGNKTPLVAFIALAKNSGTTYVVLNYTADDNTDLTITAFVRWSPLTTTAIVNAV